jgi:hypothetical protein
LPIQAQRNGCHAAGNNNRSRPSLCMQLVWHLTEYGLMSIARQHKCNGHGSATGRCRLRRLCLWLPQAGCSGVRRIHERIVSVSSDISVALCATCCKVQQPAAYIPDVFLLMAACIDAGTSNNSEVECSSSRCLTWILFSQHENPGSICHRVLHE